MTNQKEQEAHLPQRDRYTHLTRFARWSCYADAL